MTDIVVIGGGGHAKVIILIIKKTNDFRIIGYTDPDNRGNILGVEYLGSDDLLRQVIREHPFAAAVVGVGMLKNSVVPTKQCGSIISRGYISWLLVVHGEKSGVYKAKKVDIFKPALLCRDYQLLYLHTEFYSPEHEGGVRYNDPKVGIKWPLEVRDISERDKELPLLSNDFQGIKIQPQKDADMNINDFTYQINGADPELFKSNANPDWFSG